MDNAIDEERYVEDKYRLGHDISGAPPERPPDNLDKAPEQERTQRPPAGPRYFTNVATRAGTPAPGEPAGKTWEYRPDYFTDENADAFEGRRVELRDWGVITGPKGKSLAVRSKASTDDAEDDGALDADQMPLSQEDMPPGSRPTQGQMDYAAEKSKFVMVLQKQFGGDPMLSFDPKQALAEAAKSVPQLFNNIFRGHATWEDRHRISPQMAEFWNKHLMKFRAGVIEQAEKRWKYNREQYKFMLEQFDKDYSRIVSDKRWQTTREDQLRRERKADKRWQIERGDKAKVEQRAETKHGWEMSDRISTKVEKEREKSEKSLSGLRKSEKEIAALVSKRKLAIAGFDENGNMITGGDEAKKAMIDHYDTLIAAEKEALADAEKRAGQKSRIGRSLMISSIMDDAKIAGSDQFGVWEKALIDAIENKDEDRIGLITDAIEQSGNEPLKAYMRSKNFGQQGQAAPSPKASAPDQSAKPQAEAKPQQGTTKQGQGVGTAQAIKPTDKPVDKGSRLVPMTGDPSAPLVSDSLIDPIAATAKAMARAFGVFITDEEAKTISDALESGAATDSQVMSNLSDAAKSVFKYLVDQQIEERKRAFGQ